MGSRFRGNDNVGVLGCVNGYSRRPELGGKCASATSAPLREPLDLSFPRKRESMGGTVGKIVRTKARRHKEVASGLRVFVRTKIVSRAAI